MKKIACVVKGYPRLSETFIAQEILALEHHGVDIIIYSLRGPTDKDKNSVHNSIRAPVKYLPEYLYQSPVRLFLGLTRSIVSRGFFRLLRIFFRDLMRDFTTNRARRFGQALVLAREIDAQRECLYAHFLHTPASVARYCAILTGLPWSCSAHAKDIWTSPEWEIREKLQDLEWLVTCTTSNYEYLRGLTTKPESIYLLYHGLDLDRFPVPPPPSNNDGTKEETAVQIISVGRAVRKKGYDVVIDALAGLPDSFHWYFVHIGAGPILDQLKHHAAEAGISDKIKWQGPASFDFVLAQYRRADIFVLGSRIDINGDRDGLPNVLMEAMTQEIPCIATDISGIPELLVHEQNGLMVESENSRALTKAVYRLGCNPALRSTLGRQGRIDVKQKYSLAGNIMPLVDKFR